MRLRMFYWCNCSAAEIFSCYVGEAEAIVRSLFARARACSPCVLFIDEIDALVGSRSFGGSGESGGDVVQGRVLASFLTEMDGIGASDAGVVLVGATNRLEVRFETTPCKSVDAPLVTQFIFTTHACQCIDAALLRPGRFDIKVCSALGAFYSESILSPIFQVAVPPPTLAQRASILSAVASEMHLAENLDVSSLAASTEGWSGAEVAAILRDAAAAAIRENADAQCIETRHVRIST
jgi:ATP-dependent 26S proteasome regulatory subunit